ncbi:hypothetical protein [Mucilaginibacter myungsuensis]|uniref:Uncharacterized protein n=1 Tax=Mucilaginibacter myungsuensis TaxID=649104 RepID=A0A929KW42_9SPHI|nr:hypothetical protein [Mucilaginibacter myungsuensis]MBE9661787.1 hypothetical protein [Mucilaginibacter myungsuensis]MDN3599779.1 hypothetical protein [Mucilaginibacter myungsuensis]
MGKRTFLILSLLALGFLAKADTITIKHFIIKDNPFGKNQMAIVATDTLNNTLENVNGDFSFTVNGFDQLLAFHNGVAFYPPKIEKSIFLYIRHHNDAGTVSKLYYVYKNNDKLLPFHISWGWLVVIPLGLILIGYLFKRLIIIAAIVFVIFFFFNHYNGLDIGTFFQSIVDGLKSLF